MKKCVQPWTTIGLLGSSILLSMLNLACSGRQDRRIWEGHSRFLAFTQVEPVNNQDSPAIEEEAEEKPNSPADPVVERLLELHNQRRSEQKLPPLSIAEKLNEAARIQAQYMVESGNLTHQGPNGSNAADRVRRLKYPFQNIGENVAFGQETAENAMQSWMESNEHRENILGHYEEMGAARLKDEEGRAYWCVVFGTPLPQLDQEEVSKELLQLINERRAEEGLPEIKAAKVLNTVAQDHAQVMAKAGRLRQDSPDGQTPFERLHAMDYKFRKVALSIASGHPRPKVMLDTLLNDPEQRRNVLGKFNQIGISYVNAKDGTPYWTILFAETPTETESR